MDHIKTLGIAFDVSLLTFMLEKFAKDVHMYHIYGLRHVHAEMSVNRANMVACTIVGARLYYGNPLFFSMSEANLDPSEQE